MDDEKRPETEAEKMEDVRPTARGLEDDGETDESVIDEGFDDESDVGNPHGYWEAGDY